MMTRIMSVLVALAFMLGTTSCGTSEYETAWPNTGMSESAEAEGKDTKILMMKIGETAGDIVLYAGNQLVIFYGSNSWAYTKLGKINLQEKELKQLLGNGDVTATLSVE